MKTKRCTMNCGPAKDDLLTWEERTRGCEDCVEVNEQPAQPNTDMFNAMLVEASKVDGAMPDTAALQARIAELKFSKREAETRASDYANTAQELRARIVELEAQLAAQAGQELEGKSSGYITTVPDKSDRIVWRNHYYHLPIKSPVDIVQATLEAAAQHIEGMGKLRSECAGFVSQPVSAVTFNYVKAIRAIDPQTILDGMNK